jgi:hypothetical protein
MVKKCEQCNKKFDARIGQRFCSKGCAIRSRHKEDIGLFRDEIPDEVIKYIQGLNALSAPLALNNDSDGNSMAGALKDI